MNLLRCLIPSYTRGTNGDLGRIVERWTEHCGVIPLKSGLHKKTIIHTFKTNLSFKKNAFIPVHNKQKFVFYLDSYSKLLLHISISNIVYLSHSLNSTYYNKGIRKNNMFVKKLQIQNYSIKWVILFGLEINYTK